MPMSPKVLGEFIKDMTAFWYPFLDPEDPEVIAQPPALPECPQIDKFSKLPEELFPYPEDIPSQSISRSENSQSEE